MSDLRKAIEELADEWEASSCSGLVDQLRTALAANPEPEPEWEYGVRHKGGAIELEREINAKGLMDGYAKAGIEVVGIVRRTKLVTTTTAPGPWIEVGDDE